MGALGKLFSHFSEGGYTGPGCKKKPVGIMLAGEFVFDTESAKKASIRNLAELKRLVEVREPFRNTRPKIPSLSADVSGCIEWLHTKDRG